MRGYKEKRAALAKLLQNGYGNSHAFCGVCAGAHLIENNKALCTYLA